MSFIRDYNYRKYILGVRKEIKKNQDDLDFIKDKMNELYRFMKEIAPKYADKDGKVNYDYYDFAILLNENEGFLPLHFILKNNPDYDVSFPTRKIDSDKLDNYSEEEIIKYIVNRARSFLSSNLSETPIPADLAKSDLLDHCAESTSNVIFICNALHLNSEACHIVPAFCYDYNIYGSGNNHVYASVQIRDKSYIVDITYSQFFKIDDNNLNRLGIPLLGGCAPGIYMAMTSERKEFAEKLMRDGYFEATDEFLKLYFDGFAMSYRNGLYYEDKRVLDYTTDYTAADYLNFIAGRDNQLNHENPEFLGRQRKILKNPDMSFIPRSSDR